MPTLEQRVAALERLAGITDTPAFYINVLPEKWSGFGGELEAEPRQDETPEEHRKRLEAAGVQVIELRIGRARP
jgi:hypothetical protein